MRIHLIAVGTRMPDWVTAGYEEYAKRMPPECRLELVEIHAGQRGRKLDPARAMQVEGERQLAAIPKGALVIALDERGRNWDTPEIAQRLGGWLGEGRDVALLVGGADGLAPDCRTRADLSWSLSRMVFPHPLVRVILAEQLYRAWSLLNNHPYHRA
ncbi:MAG: 23S rRNA (pseudouridine(1915)-N(3))-methyltransferase RlmH [Gammaproteobacteria bacterium]|nr:23S rRNA (pseudouridine(1915)-N(3))-methyltransferase RlmH [Gammaproteobacteria bacterium]MCP5136826.1 23S rRNA (pseudouridine(1915)-N(3))-methyltransferase RlmH [Gammaproteobacteria bacterium]